MSTAETTHTHADAPALLIEAADTIGNRAAERDTLRRLYPTHTGQEIADLLGLPLKKVYSKAHTIGLNKPGEMPHNWRAVGADRVSKEGYLQRKIADTGVSRRDYVPVHHLIWRMHGRDIPPGYALCFVDGDKSNVDINNLELVSRAELMRRNSVHQLPKEAALAAQLVGCIRRQINRRTRQQQQEITE